jgi:uncharacterized protein YoaH (UPF0181 family)
MRLTKDERDLIADLENAVFWAELSSEEKCTLPTRLLGGIAALLRRLPRAGRPPKPGRVKARDQQKFVAGRERIAKLIQEGVDRDEALTRVARELQRSAFPDLALEGTIKDQLQRRR